MARRARSVVSLGGLRRNSPPTALRLSRRSAAVLAAFRPSSLSDGAIKSCAFAAPRRSAFSSLLTAPRSAREWKKQTFAMAVLAMAFRDIHSMPRHSRRSCVFLFFSLALVSSASALSFNDATLYAAQGSRFQLDATQQSTVAGVISAGEKSYLAARLLSHNEIELGTRTIPAPLVSGPTGEYQDFLRASVTSASPYHSWTVGPLEPSGSATTENENDKNILQSYGDTSYACQNLWLDKSGKMNCAQNWTPPTRVEYAAMSAEDTTGLQTHTFYIKCDGNWVFSYRYYKGCYGPVNWYPQVTVTTAAPGGFVSPGEYQNLVDYRAELAAAVSSITASGFFGTTAGITTNNIQNYYNYITEGYPVVSSGTAGGSGGTGSVGTSSGTYGPFNYIMYADTSSGEWNTYNSTSTLYPILDGYYTEISSVVAPITEVFQRFVVDVGSYTVCQTSFTLNCGPFGAHSFDFRDESWTQFTTIIDIIKWSMKAFTLALIILILVG